MILAPPHPPALGGAKISAATLRGPTGPFWAEGTWRQDVSSSGLALSGRGRARQAPGREARSCATARLARPGRGAGPASLPVLRPEEKDGVGIMYSILQPCLTSIFEQEVFHSTKLEL
ncbi:uncharacterized protein GJ701_016727 [Geothlypis trichas]